ncbi:hypothetical protein AY601_0940 [Pedobacter cryoconitis]|uniref:RNA-directed DNA polymerase n=1 Tax=Pedobacter cryoconitis TaxID=188932 RepID=A0A127V9G1_9SPHI|nr:reverse transcriptase domain-containing protein [Pedobacter cryoconitis]AMP97879.1 hypothetical protein AY601_0940 [Pedobacter cryoconitis]
MKKKEELAPEYLERFLQLNSIKELSTFLNLRISALEYFLFYAPDEKKYRIFKIQKRNGNLRSISTPTERLKEIQQILQIIFQYLYAGKPSVHGFVQNKSIITNAKLHINKKILVNIDLSDFFSSISFGRIKGIFLNHPFNFNEEVSNALTRICCHDGSLPQGAPTSPILSNFVCRQLDNQFMKLSKTSKVLYSRYADDITISTNLKSLPQSIGIIETDKLELSNEIKKILHKNGFKINYNKVRFALKTNRQEVTGLIVNKFINIKRDYLRQVKSMLNAWEKYGLYLAAFEHFSKFNPKTYMPGDIELAYTKELAGKINYIGIVRGRDDGIYEKLYTRIKVLAPSVMLSIIRRQIQSSKDPILFTEGKSDIKHIEAAFSHFRSQGLYHNLSLHFHHYKEEDKMSNGELLKFCETFSKSHETGSIVICLFDRDDENFLANVASTKNTFKEWGNKVFSMVLPIPDHRKFTDICIEHFYTDKEITTKDKNGRRIYLSNEFNKETGQHAKEKLTIKHVNKLQARRVQIIDSGVINTENINFALSKNQFAENIFNKVDGFDSFNFEAFKLIFDNIQTVIDYANDEAKKSNKIEMSIL